MTDLPTVLIHGDLELRAVDPSEVDAVLEAIRASIVELNRWQPWASLDYDRGTAMTWACQSYLGWQDGTAHNFTVRRRGEPEVLGAVGLNAIQGGQANLGYWTRTTATGRGVATTATRLCARFAFDHVGLRRVHLHHAVGNEGSRRVAEKAGFVREGLHRQAAMLHEEPIDAVFYSLVAPDEIVPHG